LFGLILASVVGYTLVNWVVGLWSNHWLRTDTQQGVALITSEHWSSHGRVAYKYTVDQKEYTGVSATDSLKPPSEEVGTKATVYYSASHPWISSLRKPLPLAADLVSMWFMVILFIFELLGLVMLFEPSKRLRRDFLLPVDSTEARDESDSGQR
jgi:hypothetical protein